jgi:hypothetical protein
MSLVAFAAIVFGALALANTLGGKDSAAPTPVSSNIVRSTSPPPSMPPGGVSAGLPSGPSRSQTDAETLANELADSLPAGSEEAADPYGEAEGILRLCRNIDEQGPSAVEFDKNLSNVVFGAHGDSPDRYNEIRRLELRVACPQHLSVWDQTSASN